MMGKVTDDELVELNAGNCPTCHHRGFVPGPRGGLNMNIECANLDCRDRFNTATFSGHIMNAERIPKRVQGGEAWPSEPPNGAAAAAK